MAYGDSPHDKDLKANWAHFCDRLKAAVLICVEK